MKYIIIILLIILALIVAAYISFNPPKLINVQNLEIVNDTDNEITIEAEINVFNSNYIDLESKDLLLNIYIDNNFIGTALIKGDVCLSSQDTSKIKSIIKIKKDLINSSLNMNDTININLLGESNLPFTTYGVYFEFNYDIKLIDYVTPVIDDFIAEENITITDVKMRKVDFSNIYLDFQINFDNKTEISYNISKLDVSIYKSNSYTTEIGNSSIDNVITIYADSLNKFKSAVKLKTIKIGTAIFSNIFKNKHEFFIKINSKINYDNITLPLTIRRKLMYNPLTFSMNL